MIPVVLAVVVLAALFWPKRAQASVVDTSEENVDDLGYVNGLPVKLDLAPIGNGYRLRGDAADAYLRMLVQAHADGIDLPVDSAFRTAAQQADLNRRLGSYGVNGGLAAPVGFSPHQGGYAIDVVGLNPNASNYVPARAVWLDANGPAFGWYRVGLKFKTVEPWHLEYKG
jgi:D-alanyl-D-alanine carboxypeptidase